MLSRGFYFIVVVCLVKVDFLYQAQFLERLQGSINSGQAEAGLSLSGSTIDFISIQVSLPVANDFQN